MNWKLIAGLALFGLVMAIATVYVIPHPLEDPAWIGVIAVSAWIIAVKAPGRPFAHGFLVGLANWISVAGSHVILSTAFLARHPDPGATASARWVPATGLDLMRHYQIPVPGASAFLIGLLAWAGSKFLARKPRERA